MAQPGSQARQRASSLPGKDASLEEQIAYSAYQKDPNEDLLDYVRGGSPFDDSAGRRKSLMKLV